MAGDKILMTVSSPGAKPDIGRAAEVLGVSQKSLDADFGVVSVDPEQGLYAVKVEADAVPAHPPADAAAPYRGPFSNPRIEAFGPRRKQGTK